MDYERSREKKMNFIFLSLIFLSSILVFFRVFRAFRGFSLMSIVHHHAALTAL
jgi:hypothetical protein